MLKIPWVEDCWDEFSTKGEDAKSDELGGRQDTTERERPFLGVSHDHLLESWILLLLYLWKVVKPWVIESSAC